LAAAGVPHQVCENLTQAVGLAYARAEASDNVLLSPGFSSLDQFKGYADRGLKFESLVKALSVPNHS